MIPYPKPDPREPKERRPIKRSRMRRRGAGEHDRRGTKSMKRLRQSPYQHPAWKKLRRLVMVRAKHRCEAPTCKGTSKATQVHHLRYGAGSGWRRLIVPMKWLVATCADCHSDAHPLNYRGQMLKVKLQDNFLEAP